MKFFDELGNRVLRAWRARDFDEHAFPALATEALQALPPASHVTYAEVIEAFVSGHDLLLQPRDMSFGQPPITVFHGPGFHIDVLCWLDGTTSIHDHAFCGAFHVMAGASIHSQYRFAPTHRFNSMLFAGDVAFQSAALLRRGDVHPIAAGRRFIHGLFHLDRPSISVVVRTSATSENLPQLVYHAPHVAVDAFVPEPIAARHQRLLALKAVLAQTDPPAHDRFVERVCATGDVQLLWFLLLQQSHAEAAGGLDAALRAALRARYAARGEQLLTTVDQARWLYDLSLRRQTVLEADHRVFLAMLLNVPDRARVLDLAAAYAPGDPSATVARWIDELIVVPRPGAAHLLEVALDYDEPPAGLALDALLRETIAAMMRGARGADLVARLRPTALAGAGDDLGDDVVALQDFLLASSLAPLFR